MQTNYNNILVNSCYYSAGVGRTGTFIAIDTEIQRMKNMAVIDVYNCVRGLRYWRNFMVQTLVSYTCKAFIMYYLP